MEVCDLDALVTELDVTIDDYVENSNAGERVIRTG